MRLTEIPIVVCALRTISKGLEKGIVTIENQ